MKFLPPANEVWGKVIFLHQFVILFTGVEGACMVAQGHAWLLQGACMVALGETCMVALGGHAWLLLGGMCGCSGGHAWLLPGACVGYNEIRRYG